MLNQSLRAARPITVRLLNYRADGSTFINDLTVMPLVDGTTTTHFIGLIREYSTLPSPAAPPRSAPLALLPPLGSAAGEEPRALSGGSDEEPTGSATNSTNATKLTVPSGAAPEAAEATAVTAAAAAAAAAAGIPPFVQQQQPQAPIVVNIPMHLDEAVQVGSPPTLTRPALTRLPIVRTPPALAQPPTPVGSTTRSSAA